MRTRSGEWILALIAGGGLLLLLLATAFGVRAAGVQRAAADELPLAEAQTATAVGAGLAGVRVDRLNVRPDEPAAG